MVNNDHNGLLNDTNMVIIANNGYYGYQTMVIME